MKKILALTFGCFLISSTVQAQTLEWEVVNRFPLIAADEFSSLENEWKAAPPPQDMHGFIVHRMTSKKVADKFLLVDPTVARGRARLLLKESITVKLTLKGGRNCSWITLPNATAAPATSECQASINVLPHTPTRVEVRDGTGATFSTEVNTKDVLIVAMGDSYSSGEGAPDRPAIYPKAEKPSSQNSWFLDQYPPLPAEWFDPVCHRSLLAWPVLTALRLALEHKDLTVRLLNTTCSGAEFFDGLLHAQAKAIGTPYAKSKSSDPDDAWQSELTPYRNGEGLRTLADPSPALYLHRSQVNQVREALCAWSSKREDVSIVDHPFSASWQECPSIARRPDALLLTAGGNDVKFGPAVGGVLFPSKARSMLAQPLLDAARLSASLITPDQLARNARRFSMYYSDFVDATIKGALSSPENTVLMSYPNPIGPVGVNCYSDATQLRIQAAFMTFGPMVKTQMPWANWVVDLHPKEVREFTQNAYPAVQAMVRSAAPIKVDWLASVRDASGRTPYDGRLLCTDDMAKEDLEPVYFCQHGKDACTAKPLKAWNSEMPGRRLVNAANDALLAQRTWKSHPSTSSLSRAAAGTFHPNAEAHAVAADSAYTGLCQVLKRIQGLCGSHALLPAVARRDSE